MTTTATLTPQEVARRTGYRLYEDYSGSGSASDSAEHQTTGRTYYYSAGTRRGFSSRVLSLRAERGGLLLCCVTSDKGPDDRRIYRAVVHDLSGACLYRSCDSDPTRHGFSRAAAAESDLAGWLEHYHDTDTEASRVLDEEIALTERKLATLRGEN